MPAFLAMPILQRGERVQHQGDAGFHVEHAGASQFVVQRRGTAWMASVPSG